ncbi:uncharacterized protein Pyn_05362 [Prunus yedoensis var. nudiflora]|uniref:Uncharacterized protein n=1 Tax=Prunus yedoensis var. nudiflora TaxID=2094558 RepID=A0A314Y5K3_PRUYE|nr:uncharacterized protein Pyn_05362 [Prunus yedoensis var. nudiflora]
MVSRPPSSGRPYGPSSSTDSRPFTRENKDDLKCNFCGQTRHTEDTCFHKHGVPEWFQELKKKLRTKERSSSGASGRRPPMVAATTGNKDVVPTQGDPSQALLTRLNPSESSLNTEETALGGVHGVPSNAGDDAQSPPDKPAPSIPQLLTKEETTSTCIGASEEDAVV